MSGSASSTNARTFLTKYLCRKLSHIFREIFVILYSWVSNTMALGHSRKHPYHLHGGNRKLTPLPPSDVLIHLLLSETIFSPLPLRTAEISSVGGVWIFSGTTHYGGQPVYAVLEWGNDTNSMYLPPNTRLLNKYIKRTIDSLWQLCFVLKLTPRHFCDVIWNPRILEWYNLLIV